MPVDVLIVLLPITLSLSNHARTSEDSLFSCLDLVVAFFNLRNAEVVVDSIDDFIQAFRASCRIQVGDRVELIPWKIHASVPPLVLRALETETALPNSPRHCP